MATLKRTVRKKVRKDLAASGPTEAEIAEETGKVATQVGAVAQAAGGEAAQTLLGGQQRGQAQQMAAAGQEAIGEQVAGARMGTRDLMTKIAEQKRQHALDKMQQESQFTRSQALNTFTTLAGGGSKGMGSALANVFNPTKMLNPLGGGG